MHHIIKKPEGYNVGAKLIFLKVLRHFHTWQTLLMCDHYFIPHLGISEFSDETQKDTVRLDPRAFLK